MLWGDWFSYANQRTAKRICLYHTFLATLPYASAVQNITIVVKYA